MATARQTRPSKAYKQARHRGGAPRRHTSARIGIVLEQAADAAGLHFDQLAEAAGISLVSLHLIRRGTTRNPRVKTLAAMAKALGIPVERLIKAL